jgi:IclR family transcriptional regulator, pca regulon regulatory protein
VSEGERGPNFVQSLERGLAVIRAFDEDHTRMTVSDVARRTAITRASARRLLLTLAELGYVRIEGSFFELRPKILELGHAFLSGLPLPEMALPHLRDLAGEVGESAYLSILDGDHTVCIALTASRRIWKIGIAVGAQLPAFAGAAGRVLLAGQSDEWLNGYLASVKLRAVTRYTVTSVKQLRSVLQAVRVNGWAVVDSELEEGLWAIAAPVRNAAGAVVAAVSVSTVTREAMAKGARPLFLEPLLGAARAIEDDLGKYRVQSETH